MKHFEYAGNYWAAIITFGATVLIYWLLYRLITRLKPIDRTINFIRKRCSGYYTTRLTANPPSSRKAFREE